MFRFRITTYYPPMSAAHSRAKHNCRRGAAMEWLVVGIRAAAMAWRGGPAVRSAAAARVKREVGWERSQPGRYLLAMVSPQLGLVGGLGWLAVTCAVAVLDERLDRCNGKSACSASASNRAASVE